MSGEGTAAPSAPAAGAGDGSPIVVNTDAPVAEVAGGVPPEGAPEGGEGAAPEINWDAAPSWVRDAMAKDGKVDLQVDGKSVSVSLDQLKKDYVLRQTAHARMQEAALARKDVDALLNALRSNPAATLEHMAPQLGFDLKDVAAAVLKKELDLLEMPADQRREVELQQREQAQREREESWKRQQEERRIAAETQRNATALQTKYVEAMKAAGLPTTERVFDEMVTIGLTAAQAGYTMEPEDVAMAVRDSLGGIVPELVPNDLDELEKLIGPERLAALRKRDIERVQGQSRQPAPQAPTAQPRAREQVSVPNRYVIVDRATGMPTIDPAAPDVFKAAWKARRG
ncbi:MAG: hypothetical protein AAGH15_11505 [Myxococcota bacterium]